MSLKDDALTVCDSVRNSPFRNDLKESIRSASTGKYDSFGFNARQQRAQFLSYLIVHQERQVLEEKFSQTILPLEESTRKLLSGVHNQIQRLNKECISPLTNTLPKTGLAVNPYSAVPYRQVLDDGELELLKEDDIFMLCEGFKNHPALLKAIETSMPRVEDMFGGNYFQAVSQLTKRILNAGPLQAPEDIMEIWSRRLRPNQAGDSERRRVYQHLGALVGVRSSLAVLNQLIFNAVLHDDFFTLNENNIIDVHRNVSHVSGVGMLVTFIASNTVREWQLQPGDLMWINYDQGDPVEYLSVIELITFEPCPSFGEGIRVALRAVYDDLNPFEYLIHL